MKVPMRTSFVLLVGILALGLCAQAASSPAGLQQEQQDPVDPVDSVDPEGRPTPAEPQLLVAEITMDGEFLPTGDLEGRAVIGFPAEMYPQLKQAVPDPRLFLRDLKPARSNAEIGPASTARYDDARTAVVVELQMLGAALNLGDGLWKWEPGDHRFLGLEQDASGRHVATFAVDDAQPEEGFAIRGRTRFTLPEGASRARWDLGERALTYFLPYTGPRGQGRLKVKFDVRERIMSCLYKVYGLEEGFAAQWVGKAVITNVGDGPVTDLRVRFQLGSYSELDLWHRCPEVIPGQTVVVTYHPVLNRKIAELTSTTPTNLVAEWKYTDVKGELHEDGDGGRVHVLGRHEFIFSNLTESESTGSFEDVNSNAELIAAWVARDDPVVKQFAAAANKAAGGEGAPYSDEAAWKVLKACYEIWQENDFTYQGPVGFVNENLSFDNKIVQSMKFPRDVIRDRSGTCIELAALYCSMAQAVGLRSYMVLVPGHAFPLVQLPSGNYLPVESTGVGGGQRFGTASFEEVVAAATKTYQEMAQAGTLIEIDVQRAWGRGVSNPELEAVPADVLQRWKTVLAFTLSPDSGRPAAPSNGPVQPTDPVQPTNPTTPPTTASYVGSWEGTVQQPLPGGRTITWSVTLDIRKGRSGGLEADFSGQVQVANAWGGQDTYQVSETLQGKPGAAQLVLRGDKKITFVNGQAMQDFPDTLTVSLKDGSLSGTLKTADGSKLTLCASRR